MTLDQVGDLLQIKKSRLYDRYREWGIPHVRIGQSLRFRRDDVEAWLERQRETA